MQADRYVDMDMNINIDSVSKILVMSRSSVLTAVIGSCGGGQCRVGRGVSASSFH